MPIVEVGRRIHESYVNRSYYLYGGFIPLGSNIPEWSVLSFSRNFPDLEIHDPNNRKTHVSEISHKVYVYMSVWMLVIDEML